MAPPLSVDDVVARHEALDGNVVQVRGWIGRCYRFGCILSGSTDKGANWLSLGGSASFDADLERRKAEGHEVIVEGRVKSDCFQHPKGDPRHDPNNLVICTDRADQLADPRLIEVLGNSREK
jgi:hypothetical protein